MLLCAAVGFCILSSMQDKSGEDLGVPVFSLPPLDFLSDLFADYAGEAVTVGGIPGNADIEGLPLSVHFIDVGQAKAILIKAPGGNALIDAGGNDQGQNVLRYLAAQGVKSLDIAVGTHPHADHIGGLDTVIEGITVDKVILPDIPKELVPTTATYTDLLKVISGKKLKVTAAKTSDSYELGDALLTILAPINDYDNLNDMSVAVRLDYGDVSFLFTGDASKDSEQDMLASGARLSADVLDVGHHGGRTATTGEFLQAVKPKIAVISCGIDNSYGHPHRETLQRLEELDIKILRTDFDGTVIIATDGETLGFSTEK